MVNWIVEPLTAAHDRSAFACGVPPLDDYLRKFARQNQDRHVARSFVAVRAGEPRVLAYFTLAASAVPHADAPADLVRRLPAHPLPTVLLARLAVDRSEQRQGLGEDLLLDACHKALAASEWVGVFAVQVHAISDTAAAYYTGHGFRPLRSQPRELLLPLDNIRRSKP